GGLLLRSKCHRSALYRLFCGSRFRSIEIFRQNYVCDLADQPCGISLRGVTKHGGGKMLVGKTRQVRAVACIGTAMVYRWQAFILAHHQPKGIVELLAAIELAALEHLLEKRRATHARMIEIFVPELEIFDRGVQTSGSDGVEVGQAHPKGFVLAFLLVAKR